MKLCFIYVIFLFSFINLKITIKDMDNLNKTKFGYICEKIFPLSYRDEFQYLLRNSVPVVLGLINGNLIAMSSLLFCGHIKTYIASAARWYAINSNFNFKPIYDM